MPLTITPLSPQLRTKYLQTFHISAQFPFTTSVSELDYYHQEVNVQVALRVAEQIKT